MRKLIYVIILATISVFTSCEYDILDSKPGEPLPPVSNVTQTVNGTNVTLSWNLPTSYPADVIQPVSVVVRITKDGVAAGTHVLNNAPTNFTYSGYESGSKYRFTVKVRANVDTVEPHLSNLRYSPGVTVEI